MNKKATKIIRAAAESFEAIGLSKRSSKSTTRAVKKKYRAIPWNKRASFKDALLKGTHDNKINLNKFKPEPIIS